MQHLGYRMRYGKLTAPDAKVDTGLMQRQFNAYLKKKGSLSGRMLDVKADYDRRFILVDSAIGKRIDDAFQWLREKSAGTDAPATEYRNMIDHLYESSIIWRGAIFWSRSRPARLCRIFVSTWHLAARWWYSDYKRAAGLIHLSLTAKCSTGGGRWIPP